MATILENGDIKFGDGTTLSTASFVWGTVGASGATGATGIVGRPTALSQFTNDLGNYGPFLSAGNLISGDNLNSGVISACGSGRGGVGHLTSGVWGLYWNGATGASGALTLQNYNCNCACNC